MKTVRFASSAIVLAMLIHIVQGHTRSIASQGFLYSVGVCVVVLSVVYVLVTVTDWILKTVEHYRIDDRNNCARALACKVNQNYELSADEKVLFEVFLRAGVIELERISSVVGAEKRAYKMRYRLSSKAAQLPLQK